MKKYSKKIALILALTLALSIAIPVLASETHISGSYVQNDGKLINVMITGGDVQAIINQKGRDVYLTADDTTTKFEQPISASGHITTMPIVGVNMGSKVKISATVTSTPLGNLKFSTSVPAKLTKNKTTKVDEFTDWKEDTSAMVFLEVKHEYGLNYDAQAILYGDGSTYNGFDAEQLLTALSQEEWKTPDVVAFNTQYKATKKADKNGNANDAKFGYDGKQLYKDSVIVLKKGNAGGKIPLITLEAPAEEGKDPNANCFVARLTGWTGKGKDGDPKKTWGAGDGFTASIVWTIQTVAED